MNWYTGHIVKAVARITSALFLGGIIIVSALLFAQNGASSSEHTVAVVETPTREYIAPVDSDGDGVSDWEEQFQQRLVVETTTATTSVQPYTPPDTVTGQYAVKLFEQFLFNDPTVPLTPEEREALVEGTFAQVASPVVSVLYEADDLTVTDGSFDSVRAYGNALGETLLPYLVLYESDTGELHIVERALATNNPEKLSELDPIRISYQQLVQDMLLVSVPPQFVDQHLAAVNAARGIFEDVGVMKQMFTDPLLALAYLNRYSENTELLYTAYASIFNNIYGRGVRYANDEPAGVFMGRVGLTSE